MTRKRKNRTQLATVPEPQEKMSFSQLLTAPVNKGWMGYGLGEGWPGAPMNFWQMGQSAVSHENTGVYSCVRVLAHEIAKLRIYHYKKDSNDDEEKVEDSPITAIFRKPNRYQSRTDFLLFMARSLLLEGRAIAYAEFNSRNDVTSLYPVYPRSAHPFVDDGTGEIFYNISTDPLKFSSPSQMVPQRYILNIRMFCPKHPLIGETPLVAAAVSGTLGSAIQMSNLAFFDNMARPSGVLTTPQPLKQTVADEIRTKWNENSSGMNRGKVPVLTHDLKWQSLAMSAVDAEIIAQYKLTLEDIARVYGVPMYMLGDMTRMTFNNVETLQRMFYSMCLGFYLEHFEANLDDFFALSSKEDEYLAFDVEAGMMRSEFATRVAAYKDGAQGGLFTLDEARKDGFGKGKQKGGDVLFMQAQMTPIDRLVNPPEPVAPIAPPAPPAPPVPKAISASDLLQVELAAEQLIRREMIDER